MNQSANPLRKSSAERRTSNHQSGAACYGETEHNGKDFNRLEKADIPDEEKLITQALAQDVEAALEPLKAAIEREGGSVIIDIKGPRMFQIAAEDLSEALLKKVHSALTPR